MHVVDRHAAGCNITAVTVEEEYPPKPACDQALHHIHEDLDVDGIADAYRSRKCLVVIRRADPQQWQKQRLLAELGLGATCNLGPDHAVG